MTQADPSTEAGRRNKMTTRRLTALLLACLGAFALLGWKVLSLGLLASAKPQHALIARPVTAQRPQIFDRNGALVAGNIPAAALYADPRHISNIDDTVDRLALVLPGLNTKRLLKALASKRRFVWVHRELSPQQQTKIHALGLTGLHFSARTRRVYPQGNLLSHILGYVDVDNKGRAGVERYIDHVGKTGLDQAGRVVLAADLPVQFVLRDELAGAMARFAAKAATGLLLDIHSGEVLAASSLPDYDPNAPAKAILTSRLDQLRLGVYELGSVFKLLTVALALELGLVDMVEKIDVSTPLDAGGFSISDHHGGQRQSAGLNVEEIFVRSSNVGAAKLALRAGAGLQRAFLHQLGLLSAEKTDIGVIAPPSVPKNWRRSETVTIAYGHGLALSPLQFTAAAAALFNGGRKIIPRFLKQTGPTRAISFKPVVRPDVGKKLAYLMQRNVEVGTGRKANVAGLRVGGKTGTAEKVIGGRYRKGKLRTTFLSVFPADQPKYLLFVMLDEAKRNPAAKKNTPASANAAPLSGRIITRLIPILKLPRLLSVQPAFDEQLVSTY